MNKLTTIALVLLVITYSTSQQQPEETLVTVKMENPEITNGFTVTDDDYTVHFDIENTKEQEATLVISIELHNGSHYISPNAKRDFSGKFYMDLGSDTDLSFEGNVVETPRSVEEFDPHPFTNGLVNWVRINTTYKQPLLLKSKGDFEVFGKIQFTIEPRCTFEEIPFSISYQNGEMKITLPKC